MLNVNTLNYFVSVNSQLHQCNLIIDRFQLFTIVSTIYYSQLPRLKIEYQHMNDIHKLERLKIKFNTCGETGDNTAIDYVVSIDGIKHLAKVGTN